MYQGTGQQAIDFEAALESACGDVPFLVCCLFFGGKGVVNLTDICYRMM